MSDARSFQTTTGRGLDFDLFPMRLFQKAKRHGIWDPQAIDFSQDKIDWQTKMNERQREDLLQRNSLFQAGEEAVTLDLLPLIRVVAAEGRLEDEIYLTSFLWEEAKHTELFQRFFQEVATGAGDLDRFQTPTYRRIFHEELPQALGRLDHDPSPVAQAEASVTYNMIIEGVLAETGYYAYYRTLADNGVMPGMQEAVALLKRDESRHLAYGVYLLSRLVAEHGDPVWEAIQRRMQHFFPMIEALNLELWQIWGDEGHPWGLDLADVQRFSQGQFAARMQRIETARTQSLRDINAIGYEVEVEVEATA